MYKRIVDEEYGKLEYEINEEGIVRNIKTKKEIKQQDKDGYKVVHLSKDGLDIKKRVHRLVAIAFLDKKEFKSLPSENREEVNIDLLEVNHIDLNRKNNNLSNLEWCTRAYNTWHGYANNPKFSRMKAIVGVNKKTKEIIEFDSLYMAGKHFCKGNYTQKRITHYSSGISTSIKKQYSTIYGYYWWLKEDFDYNNIDSMIRSRIKPSKYTEEQLKLIKDNNLNEQCIRFRVRKLGLSLDEALKIPKGTRIAPYKERKWDYIPDKNTKVYEGLFKKYGNLTPIEIIKEKGKKAKYKCKCDCGGEVITQYLNVLNGKTKKCSNCRNISIDK